MQNQTLTLFKSKLNPILFFFLSPFLLSVFVVPTTGKEETVTLGFNIVRSKKLLTF